MNRPECVLAHASGLLLVPNWDRAGGISVIGRCGRTTHVHANLDRGGWNRVTKQAIIDRQGSPLPGSLRPNGIALEAGGTLLLAHMGEREGGVYRLYVDGAVEPVVLTAGGEPLPPTNYVVADDADRLWITISTRKAPRALDYRASANSGFIAVAEPGQSDARIVADGLGYTNECVVDSKRHCVYVNETFGRRLTRFNIVDSPSGVHLEHGKVIAQFGAGTYPDGLALDCEGDLWVTSIISNRVLRVNPDTGVIGTVLEDSDHAHLSWTEKAYANDALGREHLDKAVSRNLQNVSNLAFGGDGLRTAFLGNLLGDSIPLIMVDIAGAPMPHHEVDLGPLEHYL